MILMVNHQSYFDIPVVYSLIRQPMVALAKKSLFQIPVFGWALRLMGFVQIDRSDRERAIRSLQDASRVLRQDSMSVLTFPEGTRSSDGQLLPFKKGVFILAIHSQLPLVPVSIRGSYSVLPRGKKRVRPGVVSVVFGEPIETAKFTLEEREKLMGLVRREIQRGLEG